MLRPNSVEQMLQLLNRFKNKYGRNYQITRNAVHDMCFRRLNLPNINRFRNFLEKWVLGEPRPLLKLLKKFTPSDYHTELENILKDSKSTFKKYPYFGKEIKKADKTFSLSLDSEITKKLKVLALMEGISNSEWLKNNVLQVVNKKYATWLKKQQN